MAKPQTITLQSAEGLAIQALSFIAGEPEELARFLTLTGLDSASIRRAAADPGFLAGVLDYVAGNEPLLLAFAEHCGVDPATIDRAHRALCGQTWDRDVP